MYFLKEKDEYSVEILYVCKKKCYSGRISRMFQQRLNLFELLT